MEVNVQAKFDEMIEPKKLKDHPKNRNKHGQDQIERLAELYKAHGFRHPIIVSKNTGFIVAGHGRKLAAIRAGIKKVPVVFQEFENDDAEYAFLISDNAIALWAELDMSAINLDIQELGPDFNIEWLGIKGFTLDMSEKEGLTDDDEIPEQVEAIANLGDLFQLGEHRLLCGDSTDPESYSILMNGEKADITFTSPPYNVGRTPNGDEQKYLNDSDDKSNDEFKNFLCNFTDHCLGNSEFVFVNIQSLAGNKVALIEYLNEMKTVFADTIIWDKETAEPAMAKNCMNSQFEYVHVFSEKANRIIGTNEFRGTISNVVRMQSRKDKDFASIHKATFPVSFAEHFVKSFSTTSVIEPFCGSGTTLIACEKHNRKCFAIELDPHYIDVIIARWENFTGQKAVKLND